LSRTHILTATNYKPSFTRPSSNYLKKQRIVFNLRYFDEMKYEDIAEITGTSVGALKASYHHAYNKIKETLLNL
jgi:DNA-directed RNA polymerase specialized sigma24 family protein